MCRFNSWLIFFVALVWGGDLQAYDLVGRTLNVATVMVSSLSKA